MREAREVVLYVKEDLARKDLVFSTHEYSKEKLGPRPRMATKSDRELQGLKEIGANSLSLENLNIECLGEMNNSF